MESFEMVAKTFSGLEDVLRDELIDLGAKNVEMGNRMVSFEGDNTMLYKANLCCRTALRILKPLVKFDANNTDELYDRIRELPWEQFIDTDSTFAVDTTVFGNEFTNSLFVSYRVKDAIVDHFSDIAGKRPSVSLTAPDLRLNVHIAGSRVTVSLDSSGEPLYKRGYRVEQTEAPINEVLAAGIILKTGWRGDCDFADPMCGSGTFLIEAALIATNTNPGIYRESFAFEKWKDFDADLFEDLYNDDSEEREFNYKIYGGDISPEAVQAAKRNVRSAKMENYIDICCKSITDWTENAPEGVLVTNPPYGERLKPENIKALYKNIGSTLKNSFTGWHAWIFGYRDEHFAEIGLKPSLKVDLFNGSLECSLREYVMFNGKYSEFRAEGGSVANERAADRHGPRKVRHISDDEWGKEAKKFNKASKFSKPDRKQDKKQRFEREDRDDRKPRFEGNDRKPSFNRDDRKPSFNRDDRKPSFNRDDRKPSFNRGDRKPRFEKLDRDQRQNKESFSKSTTYDPTKSRKPSIPQSKAEIINPVHFRSRRNRAAEEGENGNAD